MATGLLAGEVAVDSLRAGDYRSRFLEKYSSLWHDQLGKDMSQSYRIKELLQSLDDKAWNRSAAVLAQVGAKSLTPKEVMLAVFRVDM